MKRLSATSRMAAGLASISASLLLLASMLGLLPDVYTTQLDGRKHLCEAVAISGSQFVARDEIRGMQDALDAMVERNPQMLSAAVRRASGDVVFQTGNHAKYWGEALPGDSVPSHLRVPLIDGHETWGHVEICFATGAAPEKLSFLNDPVTRLFLFLIATSFLLFYLFLRKMLQHLDPSQVVPERVRSALNCLGGGLIILDAQGRIVLANEAFADAVAMSPDDLQGCLAEKLSWMTCDGSVADGYPWNDVITAGTSKQGVLMTYGGMDAKQRTFIVNCTPVTGPDGDCRGAVVGFEDVTQLEEKQTQLTSMLEELTRSREEIRRQNQTLRVLATQDPLTACLNRRSFFEQFETHFSAAMRYERPLSLVMLDIDFFKSVNDEHGHAAGDMVLRRVGACLRESVRSCDIVCRYGGEEFCVLLPHIDLESAAQAAERYRTTVEQLSFPNLSVTISLGVSDTSCGATNAPDLLNQADQSLYCAKRTGRNRVFKFTDVTADLEVDTEGPSQDLEPVADELEESIPFHAVTALISALGYRDSVTAEHSRRVADLAVAMASDLMSPRDCYVLEIAALLHDIGKIGVPDSILLKPGPLTQDEWNIMNLHDDIGVEIVASAFSSPQLTDIVRTFRVHFGDDAHNEKLPVGKDIPLSARILSIADAYDAMVSDRVYRTAKTTQQAFAELRRCAGEQFDDELVEFFIQAIEARDQNRVPTPPEVSKEAALRVGIQIVKIANALDDQDTSQLALLAGKLTTSAIRDGVPQIADLADRLEKAVMSDVEFDELVSQTQELLELCRATQRVYLEHDEATSVVSLASRQPSVALAPEMAV